MILRCDVMIDRAKCVEAELVESLERGRREPLYTRNAVSRELSRGAGKPPRCFGSWKAPTTLRQLDL